ncbi:1-deoxy-D-xylulose-5-phosphate reductoisomerase [Campylobacter fetus subsp. venerealis]|uniref:1-deoxy-D-xylulose-5-phosphate reductoisomerase n=1 Tax=Campylobacter fetus TaxID=196 RepID=UPI0018E7546B|nr:1-deoxy-D-xylulose-5-phosphate reductoisomerase [Campylobacter fetus]QQF52738.1 1-deoxy-D-xylulose-5-phosphate reductoisomerase [Campylobacter fetus subsp. venerealis]
MILLGSSGSIGKNVVFLAMKYGIKLDALACKTDYKELNSQISKFNPKFVYIEDNKLKNFVEHSRVFTSKDGIDKFLEACYDEFGSTVVINSLVGFSGLRPSLVSQKLGFKLALANKESLVAGGKFLDTKSINPIDSEHFGLKFLLKNRPAVKKMIITASGGAFYDMHINELEFVTAKSALKHPNWSMGAKITIDSATMANKLFEVLEAYHLYGIKDIEAFIERTSCIHALISFMDGSTTAHISRTDMKLAIAHAIGLEEKEILEPIDILSLKNISFNTINLKKYPIFTLKKDVLNNPDLGVIINAANEEMVYKFLNNEISFLDINRAVFKSLDKFGSVKIDDEDTVFEIDKKVREFCKGF